MFSRGDISRLLIGNVSLWEVERGGEGRGHNLIKEDGSLCESPRKPGVNVYVCVELHQFRGRKGSNSIRFARNLPTNSGGDEKKMCASRRGKPENVHREMYCTPSRLVAIRQYFGSDLRKRNRIAPE